MRERVFFDIIDIAPGDHRDPDRKSPVYPDGEAYPVMSDHPAYAVTTDETPRPEDAVGAAIAKKNGFSGWRTTARRMTDSTTGERVDMTDSTGRTLYRVIAGYRSGGGFYIAAETTFALR